MIQFFRSFFSSKIGLAVALAFLGLIAIAFASSDVASSGTFGGVSGGDRVAVVGSEKISTADLTIATQNGLDQVRQRNPVATMETFLADGGINEILDALIDRTAISEWAQDNGLQAGDRLIDSEILQIPAFRGATGDFDQEAYDQVLRNQGVTDAQLRDDLRNGLLARQVLTPAQFGARMPQSMAARYAAILQESRAGSIGLIPSQLYMPSDPPTDAQLEAYYTENRADFIRPERRTIRYASFGIEALGDRAAPTEAQIRARYEQDAERYAASETRELMQVVVPTEAAASALSAEVATGKGLVAAAREKGLAASRIESVNQADLARSTSAAVAQNAFAAQRGAISSPARGPLGFYLMQVVAVQRSPARSFEQVRGEIAEELATEQRRTALAELSASIEERFDDGANLAEVAAEVGAEIVSTDPLIATGLVYGTQNQSAPDIIMPAMSTLFQMEEGEPQIAEIDPGRQFLIFDVSQITEAAAAPLAEIREGVVAAWALDEGNAAAKEAADRVIERLGSGQTLAAALSAEERPLPAPDRVESTRRELTQLAQAAAQQGRRLPGALALMFSMAQGTNKKLEAPGKRGWFVVALESITPGSLEGNEQLVQQTQQELSQVLGAEYAEQLRSAIIAEVGIERNETAIQAVEDQLLGRNNS